MRISSKVVEVGFENGTGAREERDAGGVGLATEVAWVSLPSGGRKSLVATLKYKKFV